MDSPQFCGQVCHTVMKPEFAAYQDGPHSRVTCVQCHIGPGASWFAKSKSRGTRQVLAVSVRHLLAADSVAGAEPAAGARHLRAVPLAREVPRRQGRRVFEYADDEKNTESVTTLQVHVGGGSERLGIASGIHWHMNVANEIEYIATDDKRQVIPWVRLKDRIGNVREFTRRGRHARAARQRRAAADGLHGLPQPPEPPDGGDARARRRRAIARRRHPARRCRSCAAKRSRRSRRATPIAAAAEERSPDGCADFYRSPVRADSTCRSGRRSKSWCSATQTSTRRNVFPEMNVAFGTYRTTSATWTSRAASAATTTAQDEGGQGDRPGLRDLSQDRIVPERLGRMGECAVLNNSPCGHRVTMPGTRLAAGRASGDVRRESDGTHIGSSRPC